MTMTMTLSTDNNHEHLYAALRERMDARVGKSQH